MQVHEYYPDAAEQTFNQYFLQPDTQNLRLFHDHELGITALLITRQLGRELGHTPQFGDFAIIASDPNGQPVKPSRDVEIDTVETALIKKLKQLVPTYEIITEESSDEFALVNRIIVPRFSYDKALQKPQPKGKKQRDFLAQLALGKVEQMQLRTEALRQRYNR